MNTVQKKSLELAKALLPDHFECRTFHITALFERTRLICVGQNKPQTHAKNLWNNRRNFDLGQKNTCSELDSCLRARKKFSNLDWKRITMVNVRLGRNGEVLMSKPCQSCESLIEYLKPGQIYYTTNEGNFTEY
jgi:hypothetical protein